jgi:hypothetical protein
MASNGPIAIQLQRVCHDTLPWLISLSLGLCRAWTSFGIAWNKRATPFLDSLKAVALHRSKFLRWPLTIKSAYQTFPGHKEEKVRTSDLERLRCIA